MTAANRDTNMAAYEPGEHIKVEFKDDRTGESEWMWVRVDYSDDKERVVFGWLDSQPLVHANKLKCGQHLAISFDNVRERRKFDGEEQFN